MIGASFAKIILAVEMLFAVISGSARNLIFPFYDERLEKDDGNPGNQIVNVTTY